MRSDRRADGVAVDRASGTRSTSLRTCDLVVLCLEVFLAVNILLVLSSCVACRDSTASDAGIDGRGRSNAKTQHRSWPSVEVQNDSRQGKASEVRFRARHFRRGHRHRLHCSAHPRLGCVSLWSKHTDINCESRNRNALDLAFGEERTSWTSKRLWGPLSNTCKATRLFRPSADCLLDDTPWQQSKASRATWIRL